MDVKPLRDIVKCVECGWTDDRKLSSDFLKTDFLKVREYDMNRVSFQGERGAYSEAASISFFEGKIETIPCSTFADVLKNTENGASDYSILPVENSLEGSVGESNDL